MKEILAIIRIDMINQTKEALLTRGISCFNCRKVMGRGKKKLSFTVVDNKVPLKAAEALSEKYRLIPKRMLSIIVKDSDAQRAVDTVLEVNRKGCPGDGKIFVLPVEEVIKVSSGERRGAAV